MATYLLLHAFPLDGAMWDEVAAILRSDGHTVIAPDLRGFGSAPLGSDEPDIDRMVDDVLPLLDGPAVIAGCSMGGYVALGIARRQPGRIAGLALVDSKATADSDAARVHRERIAALAESGGDWSAGMLDGLLGATTRDARRDLVDRVRRSMAVAPAATVAWAQRAMAERPDGRDGLGALDVPVLALLGEEDTISPRAEQEIIVAAAPRARLVVLPRAGHLTPLEAPDAVADALLELAR